MTSGPKKQIPPFKLVPQPLNEEARKLHAFKWAPKEVGTRHKLGGKPDSLQVEDTPKCPDCGETMTFYGQFDSINDDYCIADCGMIFVYYCFDCISAKAIVQSD